MGWLQYSTVRMYIRTFHAGSVWKVERWPTWNILQLSRRVRCGVDKQWQRSTVTRWQDEVICLLVRAQPPDLRFPKCELSEHVSHSHFHLRPSVFNSRLLATARLLCSTFAFSPLQLLCLRVTFSNFTSRKLAVSWCIQFSLHKTNTP